jgi:hypothetical protein
MEETNEGQVIGGGGGTTVKLTPGIEWDGIVEDIGLTGVTIRPIDEHKIWATKEMFPLRARVHVKVEKL